MADFPIFSTEAKTLLTPVSGFLREAGFTHSLTPARNCTYGCTYCYVPTMRVQAGLKTDIQKVEDPKGDRVVVTHWRKL